MKFLSKVVFPLIIVFTGFSLLYSVFTGEAIGSDITYNTFGRVLNALFLVAATTYFLWSWRKHRRLMLDIEERRDGR